MEIPRQRVQGCEVVIIGGGFSGLCMALELRRQNITCDFLIIERNNEIGGTWNNNRYPGCCADAQSHLYSFSFDPNLNCKSLYPSRDEIASYLINITKKWRLCSHIRFNTVVNSAAWNEDKKEWSLELTARGSKKEERLEEGNLEHDRVIETYNITTAWLVSAVGQLDVPFVPSIPHLDEFEGIVQHSARWDSSRSLSGLRVAIIGTGATAIQLIPELTRTVSSLTIFQRSAPYVLPRNDISFAWYWRWLYDYIPILQRRYRAKLLATQETYHGIVVDKAASDFVANLCLEHLEQQIPSTDERSASIRSKCIPQYPAGCKRVLLSDTYFPALMLPNVTLQSGKISHATHSGLIVSPDSSFPSSPEYGPALEQNFDALIFATGFRAQSFLKHINITGVKNISLTDFWSTPPKGPTAYRGIVVPHFPNFSLMYGPNTNLSHVSILPGIEAQARYIGSLIRTVVDARRRDKCGWVVVMDEKAREWDQMVQERLRETTFASERCTSWYKDPETGRVTNNWPGTAAEYVMELEGIRWEDFESGERGAMGEEEASVCSDGNVRGATAEG